MELTNQFGLTQEVSFDDLAATLTESSTPVIYRSGSAIFREHEVSGPAYLIERGQVEITQQEGDEQKVLAILGPGELFGEMSPIDNQSRSATATAITETEVIPISRLQLEEIISKTDPLIQLLLRVLIERLRKAAPHAEVRNGGLKILDRDASLKSIEAIRGKVITHIKQEIELRDAFARRELDLYYQPIVRLSDYRLAGFEALIRWISPERGVVGPNDFIGVAEESGLIVPIGLWVLEHACHMLTRFQAVRDRYYPEEDPLFMSANVSARQLGNSDNVDTIISTIRRTGIDPSALKIEITEGLLLDDPEAAIIAFNRLKALGAKMALDDFGTGYSSLSYLHRFPLDTLKIDRSFVMSMLKSKESMTVVRTITRLARDLGLTCVSEGIENSHELTTLKNFGCDYGQGFLFAKPVPAAEAEELIKRFELWTPPMRLESGAGAHVT
ncbi:MAG: EAL domain-containing protein (putative c-di-GMP-specific phosphodiesterase class I) [Gammaproteobacteria bacterium]|jgi:EAL domain-containing protein (putative c-di-GMP-specific phosphodiesterase class I)